MSCSRMSAIVLLAALMSAGCASNRVRSISGRELVELDERWATAAASNDLDAIMDFWDENAVLYAPDLPPLYGKLAIREFLERRRMRPDHRIRWVPTCAGADEVGSMAYTLGELTVTQPDDTGTATTLTGRYVSIWRRDGDRWRCAVKCWTPSPRDDANKP